LQRRRERHRGCGEHATDGLGSACEVALEEQFAVACVDHDELRLAVISWQVDLPGRSSNGPYWIPNPFGKGAILSDGDRRAIAGSILDGENG